jgi:hypothetical protein
MIVYPQTPNRKPIQIIIQNCCSLRALSCITNFKHELDISKKRILLLTKTLSNNRHMKFHFPSTTRNLYCSINPEGLNRSGLAIYLPDWMGAMSHQLQGVPGYLIAAHINLAQPLLIACIYWPHITPLASNQQNLIEQNNAHTLILDCLC